MAKYVTVITGNGNAIAQGDGASVAMVIRNGHVVSASVNGRSAEELERRIKHALDQGAPPDVAAEYAVDTPENEADWEHYFARRKARGEAK